jgi:hypothetical protein
MTKFYTEIFEDSIILGRITEDGHVAEGIYPANLMTKDILSQQKQKILNETSAGNSFGRMPVIGALDRAFTEKMPWNGRLHPEFWDNDNQRLWGAMAATMKSMANDFIRKTQIPKEWIEDIIFKGSLATYNYTPTSDIDVQIILKYDWDKNPAKDPKDKQGTMLEREFSNRRAEYNKTSGFHLAKERYPVEFFLQTPKTNTRTGASARWSLMSNDWLPGYKPNPQTPGVPPKEINAYFKDYYDRVKNAYFNRLKLTNLEAALTAKKELGYISGNDRNTALHGTEENPASLTADIESPANLAFKALKRTKLVAFIETEIAKARQKGLMDMKQHLDQRGRPAPKKLTEEQLDEIKINDRLVRKARDRARDGTSKKQIPEETQLDENVFAKYRQKRLTGLSASRRNKAAEESGRAAELDKDVLHFGKQSEISSQKAYRGGVSSAFRNSYNSIGYDIDAKKAERKAKEHRRRADRLTRLADEAAAALANNKKRFGPQNEDVQFDEGLVQGFLASRRNRLDRLSSERDREARSLDKLKSIAKEWQTDMMMQDNLRNDAMRNDIRRGDGISALGHAAVGVYGHEPNIKKLTKVVRKLDKKSTKLRNAAQSAADARIRNQRLADKFPPNLEEQTIQESSQMQVYVDYLNRAKY